MSPRNPSGGPFQKIGLSTDLTGLHGSDGISVGGIKMLGHRITRHLRVAGIQGADDGAMLLKRGFRFASPRKHHVAATIKLSLGNLNAAPQQRQITDLRQVSMELVIKSNGFNIVPLLNRTRMRRLPLMLHLCVCDSLFPNHRGHE